MRSVCGVKEGRSWRAASAKWEEFSARFGKAVEIENVSGRQLWIISAPAADSWNEEQSLESPCILFIHGLGGRTEQFMGQVEFFRAKGFRVILPCLLGHEWSPKPRNLEQYSSELFLQDIVFLIKKFSTTSTFVVGHSLGSLLAVNLCSNSEFVQSEEYKRIKAIVLIGTASNPPDPGQAKILSCFDCFLELLRPLISHKAKFLLYNVTTNPELVNSESRTSSQNPFHVLRGIVRNFEFPAQSNFLSVRKPALIIHGVNDGVNPVRHAHKVSEWIKDSSLTVIQQASHNVMQEKPHAVNDLIYNFFLGF